MCDGEVYAVTKKKHVVLLGASVGHAWDIASLPERLNQGKSAQGYTFEFVGDYQFDKTQTLKDLLQRKQNKPDAIILKECAAYYPGDLNRYQELMKGWIKDCKDARVVPVPTTVVPVAKATSMKNIAKDLIRPLLGKATSSARLESLLQYNDWIRAYAKQEGLTVLDLEETLRTSEADRRLRVDLHSGDGLHLNAQAYTLLDRIVIPTLDKAFSKK
jgi:lysophospholipase L1-like esterase